jgi:hypothetical protein
MALAQASRVVIRSKKMKMNLEKFLSQQNHGEQASSYAVRVF